MDITFFMEIVPSYKLSITRHFFSVREGVLVENVGNVSNAENATISSSDVNTPSFEELTAGWTSRKER
jgi:hypothetical protein